MDLSLKLGLVLSLGAGLVQSQQGSAEIRGSVVNWSGEPVQHAEVQARLSGRLESEYVAKTAPDGSYKLQGLPTGGIGGILARDENRVTRATVMLSARGKGRVSSTWTDDDGRFRFSGLHVGPDSYSIAIRQDGFFIKERTELSIQSGFASVSAPITLESCSPGKCQPALKTIPVLPACY